MRPEIHENEAAEAEVEGEDEAAALRSGEFIESVHFLKAELEVSDD